MKRFVSIVFPTLNAGPDFCQLLERVTTQKGSRPEIVVVDSGSSDGTPDIARSFGARVIEIAPGTFNHGLTRNLGIEHSQGEICVLLVQDALPVADDWLEALTHHFDRDPLICGVTTRQVPRPEADMVTRWEVTRHNGHLGREVRMRTIPDWSAFEKLPIQDKFFVCNFDNVCSAIRRSIWKTHPFRSLPFAEDLDWAVRVLRAGNKIVYEPAAVVIHSHVRPAIYHLRRHYVSAKVVPAILECPVPGVFSTNDHQMFSAVNALLQEASILFLLVDQLDRTIDSAQWHGWVKHIETAGLDDANKTRSVRQFSRKYFHELISWSPLPERFKSALERKFRHNPMRAHFLFLLSEIAQDVPQLETDILRHLIVHCLARTVGHFLGGYYLRSDRLGQISPELRALDQCLCVGV